MVHHENIKACNQGGCQHCWDVSIEHDERVDKCICIPGEENASLEAGITLSRFQPHICLLLLGRRQCQNGTLYVTHNPCRQCSKIIPTNKYSIHSTKSPINSITSIKSTGIRKKPNSFSQNFQLNFTHKISK